MTMHVCTCGMASCPACHSIVDPDSGRRTGGGRGGDDQCVSEGSQPSRFELHRTGQGVADLAGQAGSLQPRPQGKLQPNESVLCLSLFSQASSNPNHTRDLGY